MIRNIETGKLKIGMYVILPLSWHEHSFLKNSFPIASRSQINRIRDADIRTIEIDTEKGCDLAEDSRTVPVTEEPDEQEKIIPDMLMEAIYDKTMDAPRKAALVHEQSVEMMRRLYADPSAENIKTIKKGIADVVNLILTDNETVHHLMGITSHDYYTFTHSVTVGILGVVLCKTLFKKSDGHNLEELGAGFFLHDIGKVNINQDILTKPGRLADEEMAEMKRHPALGFRILNDSKQLTEESKSIVLQHHERFDGKGYPRGLKGTDIHLYGRICTIADVYDALTSKRPYREPLPPFAALQLMRKEMLPNFQQDLFNSFVKIFA